MKDLQNILENEGKLDKSKLNQFDKESCEKICKDITQKDDDVGLNII